MKKKLYSAFIAVLAAIATNAQPVQLTLEEAVQRALQNNQNLAAASLEVDYQHHVKRAATDIGKTSVMYMRGQYNSYVQEDNNITLSQSIPFPTVFTAQHGLGKAQIRGSELKRTATANELVYQVRLAYYRLMYVYARHVLLQKQDSLFSGMVKAADLRHRTGEARLLEKTTAETQLNEIRNLLYQSNADAEINRRLLQTLVNSSAPVDIVFQDIDERTLGLPMDSAAIHDNPHLAYLKQLVDVASGERKVAVARFLPDITVGYFSQTLIGTPRNASGDLAQSSDRFQGFMIGLAVPLWFGPQTAKVKAAAINRQKAQVQFEYNQTVLQGEWQQAVQEYLKNKNSVAHYRSSALQNAALMLKQADLAFTNGEIGYTEYWLTVRQAIQVRESYLTSLHNLNQSILSLEYLAGK
jgi:cobalt-zinc-cadmium resistance protein CzcA